MDPPIFGNILVSPLNSKDDDGKYRARVVVKPE